MKPTNKYLHLSGWVVWVGLIGLGSSQPRYPNHQWLGYDFLTQSNPPTQPKCAVWIELIRSTRPTAHPNGKGIGGVEMGSCIGCKQEFRCSENYRTSHLHRHVSSCKFVLYHDIG